MSYKPGLGLPPDGSTRLLYKEPPGKKLEDVAKDLTLAAQGAPSRPTSEMQPLRSETPVPVTPPNKTKNSRIPPSKNSPFDDPKFNNGRDQYGRKPSASEVFRLEDRPEDFYLVNSRSHTPSSLDRQAISRAASLSRQNTPKPVQAAQRVTGAMQQYINEGAREPRPMSEDIGLCDYEIQAQRLSMARLRAAKSLIEQAHEHKDLDPSLTKEEHPLYPSRNTLEEIMFQLTNICERLGNSKLVKDYDKAYTIPKDSKFYGKGFNKVVCADADKMLSGCQAVVDQIVREIQ